jgi:hypothetical protein
VAADDDLNAPLGQEKPKSKLPKLPFGAPQLLAGLLGLFGLVAVGWAVFGNDPLGDARPGRRRRRRQAPCPL